MAWSKHPRNFRKVQYDLLLIHLNVFVVDGKQEKTHGKKITIQTKFKWLERQLNT